MYNIIIADYKRGKMKKFIFLFLIFITSKCAFALWTDVDKSGQERIVVYDENDSFMPQISCTVSGDPYVTWYVQNPDGSTDVYLLKWAGNGWTDIDGTGVDDACITCGLPGSAMNPKVEIDSAGFAHLVWEQWIPGYSNEIYYTRWDGTQWVTANGTPGFENVSQTPLQSSIPSLKVGYDLKAMITWHEGSDEFNKPETAEICFLRFNGTAWADADGSGRESMNISQTASYPSLFASMALDGAGRPVIAWSDGPETNREIYLLRFNGLLWTDISGNPAKTGINMSGTAGYSSWPDVDIDSTGNPNVVWEDFSTGYQDIYYLKWNGNVWVDVDGVGTDRMNVSKEYHLSSVPKIKIDASGVPHILFGFGTTETNERYCIKWSSNISDWTGEGGYGTENITNNDINDSWSAFDLDELGYPVVVWNAGRYTESHSVRLLRWQPDGTPTVTPTISPTSTIVIGATFTPTFSVTRTITPTRTPTITKTCTSTMTFNPKPSATPNICWVDADGTGQESKKVTNGTQSDAVNDMQGNPMITFAKSGDIYFTRWNGASWTSAGGQTGIEKISYMVDNGFSPCIKTGANGMPCIVWAGGLILGWQDLFYLQWNGSAWVDVDGTGVESISIPYHSIYDSRHPEEPSLTIHEIGGINKPGVAWSDYYQGMTWTVRDIIYVQRPGNVWCDIDGSGFDKSKVSDSVYNSHSPYLCQLEPGNFRPFIAWIADSPLGGIVQVKREQSGNWVNMDGSIGPAVNPVTNPFIFNAAEVKAAICPLDSYPAIVFTAISGGTRQVCYLKWNGNEWVDIDGAGQESVNISMSSGNASGPSIAFDSNCNPNISWYDTTGIHFIKWNGGGFVDATGNIMPRVISDVRPGTKKNTKALILPGNIPAVSWFDDIDGQDDVYYLRFNCTFNTPTNTATVTPTITNTPFLTATPSITATPTVTQRPSELKIAKRAKGEEPKPGSLIEYTISIENNDSIQACCINVWDTLPENISFYSSELPYTNLNGRFISWRFANTVLQPGDKLIFSFKARIDYLRSDSLIINKVSCDWHDFYYTYVTHPAIDSEFSYFPEGYVKVYPNPFGLSGNRSDKIKFINIVPGSIVKIYTLSGELVNTIFAESIMVEWNTRNRFGYRVSPGIYYYTVVNSKTDNIQKGKLFILKQEEK